MQQKEREWVMEKKKTKVHTFEFQIDGPLRLLHFGRKKITWGILILNTFCFNQIFKKSPPAT